MLAYNAPCVLVPSAVTWGKKKSFVLMKGKVATALSHFINV